MMSHNSPKLKKPQTRLPVAKLLPPPVAADDSARGTALAGQSAVPVVRDSGGKGLRWWGGLWQARGLASFMVSLVVHVAILVVLSLLVRFAPDDKVLSLIVVHDVQRAPDPSDVVDVMDVASLMPEEFSGSDSGAMSFMAGVPLVQAPAEALAASRPWGRVPTPLRERPGDLLLRGRKLGSGGFQGRRGKTRQRLLAERGGNEQSQDAVLLGLAWLAAHQRQDGGWRFDLSGPPCLGQCRDSGTAGTSTGATGLALLPFLGAGQTHLQGEYRDVVQRGLYYLKRHMVMTPHGADLQEGTMYGHGIATIALCEAYGMTQDPTWREPAQRAIDFICYAQHSKGGWRYYPQQPGDTTVFGWQMMALKSAAMAGLSVPSPVISLAERFLDSVQQDHGAYYGYLVPEKRPTTTAIGLLIRMYVGWQQHDPRLARGVAYLARLGFSRTNMYFNYYATQVLNHHDGPSWPKWNVPMRDYLISTQAKSGHERGSWFFPDPHGSKGGRLYTTAMCLMILEVYYRHMPLYARHAVDSDL